MGRSVNRPPVNPEALETLGDSSTPVSLDLSTAGTLNSSLPCFRSLARRWMLR